MALQPDGGTGQAGWVAGLGWLAGLVFQVGPDPFTVTPSPSANQFPYDLLVVAFNFLFFYFILCSKWLPNYVKPLN